MLERRWGVVQRSGCYTYLAAPEIDGNARAVVCDVCSMPMANGAGLCNLSSSSSLCRVPSCVTTKIKGTTDALADAEHMLVQREGP